MYYFRSPFPLFFARTFNSLGVQRVGKGDLLSQESLSSSNIVRIDAWVVNQWWIRMIFRRKYSVPNVCCPCWIQATHAYHSQVAHRLFGLWSPRRFVAVSFDASSIFPCSTVIQATEQWRIVEIQLLAKEGWKWGCQPFSCPCSLNVRHGRREVCSTCFISGIHAFCILLWNLSRHSLPEAWSPWERQCGLEARLPAALVR